MPGVVVKHEDDLEVKYGGAFKLIRHGLGISSFGIQLINLPAGTDGYPEHDHAGDGQEELYTVLEGAAELTAGGETIALEPVVTIFRVSSGWIATQTPGSSAIVSPPAVSSAAPSSTV